MTEEYKALYCKLVEDFASKIRNSKKRYTMFIPQHGANYSDNNDHKIMLCGRAINGHSNSYQKKYLHSSAEKVLAKTIERRSDLEWIQIYASNNRFFSVVKDLLIEQFSVSQEKWHHSFLWSNLIKISPASGGNPTDKEFYDQLELSIKLFKMEIDIYKPKLIIMVTGFYWAYDFIYGLGINPDNTEITSRYKYIKGQYTYNDTNIIVTARPEILKRKYFNKSLSKFI